MPVDLLGSGVFGFVQADIKGNIEERCFLFTVFFTQELTCSYLGSCRVFGRAIEMLRRVRRHSRILSEAKRQKEFVMEPLA